MAELLAGRSGGIPAKSAAGVISFSIFVALFKRNKCFLAEKKLFLAET
jgi:hypothetical protein